MCRGEEDYAVCEFYKEKQVFPEKKWIMPHPTDTDPGSLMKVNQFSIFIIWLK
jgi:hypothetical protein